MDTSNERKENQGGRDMPDYSWEAMSPGIYDKILQEDPDFFSKKRRRRILLWLWWLPGLVVAGLCLYLWYPVEADAGSQKANTPTAAQYAEDQTEVIKEQNPASLTQADQSSTSSKTTSYNSEAPLNDSRGLSQKPSIFSGASKLSGTSSAPQTEAARSPETATTQPAQVVDVSYWEAFLPIDLKAPVWDNRAQTLTPSIHRPMVVAPARRVSHSFYSGLLLSSFQYRGDSPAAALRNEHTSPLVGYVLGLEAQVPIRPSWNLILGIERQAATQRIEIQTEREVEVEVKDALLSVTHSLVGNYSSYEYGDTVVPGIERNHLIHYNDFEFLQFQAGLSRSWGRGPWTFAPSAGLAATWLTKAEGRTAAADGAIIEYGGQEKIMAELQFRTWLGLRIERLITPKVAVNLSYRFDKQWSNGSLEEGMSLRPAYHLLTVGVVRRW